MAHYILIAKDNQPTLRREIVEFFEWQLDEKLARESKLELSRAEDVDGGHGRVEIRRAFCYEGECLSKLSRLADFRDARSIIRLERERHIGDEVESEVHYYISSLPASSDLDAARFIGQIRNHWQVENKLHWCLDVTWGEDACRVRHRNAAYNLAIIRRLALNLVRTETSLGKRVSLRNRQFRAAVDRAYLVKILAQVFMPGLHVS